MAATKIPTIAVTFAARPSDLAPFGWDTAELFAMAAHANEYTTVSRRIVNVWNSLPDSVITVRRSLHGICYSNSVRQSVCSSLCPSVCHTRGLCPHGSTYDHDFFTTW